MNKARSVAASVIWSVAVSLALCGVPAWCLSFTVEPSNQTLAVGMSLMLNCQATDSRSAPLISWQKDGTWLNDPTNQPWRYLANNSLFYQSVRKQDVGKFRCGAVISGTSNVIYSRVAEVKLAYIYAGFVTPPSNQSVRVGSAAHLDCLTNKSLPSANVYWEKDGLKFTAGQEESLKLPSSQLTSSSLLMQSASFSSSGWYRCVAINPLLPNEIRWSRAAYLNVLPSKDAPHFQIQPTNLVAAENVNAVLQCVILGVPTPHVSWTHNGQQVQDMANRYVLNNGSLYFAAPINKSFAGQYVCTGTNSAGSISSSPVLFSVAYFDFEFLENPSNETAKVGDTVALKCGPPRSYPPGVTIKWYHDYREIQPARGTTINQLSGTLTFASIKKSDEGKYFCSGTNTISQETRASAVAYVTVNVPPSFQLRPRNTSVTQSQSLLLDCKAAGSPQPSLTWTKDGLAVDARRVTILSNGSLSVRSTVVADAGWYTCTALNVAGSAAASALVAIHVRPSPTPSQIPENATRTVGESVTFVCEFDGIPKPTVTWFHEGAWARVQAQASANYILTSRSLEIRQVAKNDEGTYICQGTNAAGSSQVSVYLKVQVPASLDSGPVNVTVNETGQASFRCLGSGDPKPTVTWYKGDSRLVSGGGVVIGENNLTVLQSSRNDAGWYHCNVSNGLAFDVGTAFLFVQVVPNITVISVPRLVGLGRNASLSCVATGRPTPRITWRRAGESLGGPRVVPLAGGRTALLNVERGDNGSYTCVAENAAGRDTSSGQMFVQVPPSPPIILAAEPVSSAAIRLSWRPGFDGLSPITGYSVAVKRGNGSYSQLVSQSLVTAYLADSLAPYEVYAFKVTAWNEIGQSDAAVTLNRTLEAAPSVPRSMSAVALNATAMAIDWGSPEHPNGVVTWYEIQYRRSDNDQAVSRLSGAHSQRQAVIGGLEPYTVYVFSVRAATGQQTKLWGNFTTRESRTGEAAPSAAPQDVQLTALSSTSIRVTWKTVPRSSHNGIIREFTVLYKAAGPYHYDNATSNVRVGNIFNWTLRNLNPWTNYSVAVRAFTVDSGPESRWAIQTTLEAAPGGPPSNVTLVAESNSSIWVYMTNPEAQLRNGIIRGFTVYYSGGGVSSAVNSSRTSMRLSGLTVDTEYSVQVAAFTSVGRGDNSSAKKVRTKEGVPGVVQSLILVPESYDSIAVSWEAPTQKNGRIQSYQLTYNATDGKFAGSLSTQQLSVKLTRLSPNTTYVVMVKARTSQGYGPVATGNSTTGFPSVTVSAGAFGSILVTWEPPQSSQVARYHVHFKPVNSSSETTVTAEDVGVELKNLTTNMNYTIWVVAASTDGEMMFITTVTATTYVPTPPSATSPSVAAEGRSSGRLSERDLIIVIVCACVIVLILIVAAVYFIAVRPRMSQGKLSPRKDGSRLRPPALELQGNGLQNAGYDMREDASTIGTEDSFGSFDVPSSLTGQQDSAQAPHYAVGRVGSKKSPLVELRSKKLSLGSQDSFYDQPYSSLEELGAGFTSFGPPPPPAFRSTTPDNFDTASIKTPAVDFQDNRLSFTSELYPAALSNEGYSDPDEELDEQLGKIGSAENDRDGLHGIENRGVRSDSAEPPAPNASDGAAANPDFPVYAKPDKSKVGKYKKMQEGDSRSTASSASSHHHLHVGEEGELVHKPVLVYDERTNL